MRKNMDLILAKNAKKIEIKRFKKHDKVKFIMPESWVGAHEIIQRLRFHVEDLPSHSLRDAILAKAVMV